MNKVILIGRLGKDAESRQVGETNAINFSVATSENYTDKQGQKVENTEWHNVTLWSKGTGIVQYLKKGQLVSVEGKIKTTKKDDKYYTSIESRSVKLLGGKSDNSQNATNAPQPTQKAEVQDDLPF